MKRKNYYIYNPQELRYEKVKRTTKQRLASALYYLLIGGVLGGGVFAALGYWVESPNEVRMRLENEELRSQYQIISHQLDNAQLVLEDLQQRDDNLYRVMLQAEPLSKSIRDREVVPESRYAELQKLPDGELVASTTQKIDKLTRQLYVQAKSFDELVELGRTHEERIACLPSIQPVANKDLKRMASGYGYRIDPVYKTRRFHNGMDFSAPTGTPIYATANGTVIQSGWQQGYGYCIEIDHGYHYKTLYAHMSKLFVKKGEKVTRGMEIGLVGNTGKSTGPHLHYEVIYKGQHVNPINYYFFDLSPEEYDQMIQMAENAGQVMD